MTVSKIQSPYTPLETTEKTNEIIDQLNTNTGAIAALKDVPTGAVIPFAGSTAPTGFLICDGSAISRTTYADLFAVIGTTYGSGDGSTTFNLPNNIDAAVWGVQQQYRGIHEDSLPNITGTITIIDRAIGLSGSGCFYTNTIGNRWTTWQSAGGNGALDYNIDASRSSSVYGKNGNSGRVYPLRTGYIVCIKY